MPPEARSYAGLASDWYPSLITKGYTIEAPKPLFPRLELPAEAATETGGE